MGAPTNTGRTAGDGETIRSQIRPQLAATVNSANAKPARRPRSKNPKALLTLDPEPARRVAAPGLLSRGPGGARHGRRVSDLDQVIGNRIRAVRSARGVTQTDLGKHLGLTFQQVQKYETGSNRVSAATLVRVAAILGVPADLLLRDLDMPGLDVSAVMADGTESFGEEALLLELFRSLRDATWRMRVLELVEVLSVATRRSLDRP